MDDFCLKAPAAEAVLTSLLPPQEAHSPCHCFQQVTFIDHEAEPLLKLEEGIFFPKMNGFGGVACGILNVKITHNIFTLEGKKVTALNFLQEFP